MNWHEFIFSKKRPTRFYRHIVFWIVWWLYFFGSRVYYPKPFISWQSGLAKIRADNMRHIPRPWETYWDSILSWGSEEVIRSLVMLSIHMAACYIIIYFLLSRYLLRAKYFQFFGGVLLLGLVMVEASRLIDTVIMPAIVQSGETVKIPYYASIFAGVISGIKIIAAAVAIKLAKYWWQKQKEKEQLEKEKIETELQLLKAQIHPSFLFNTLNNIYSFALIPSPKAPEMLLKLSDILSYMLYECNDREVPLEKEIKMLNDYMTLEKLRYGDKLEMNLQVKGDTSNDKIAPLLLLRFIESSFKQCSHRMTAQPWINLVLQIENHTLVMKLMNGKPDEKTITQNGEEDDFGQVQRRLQLLYSDRYELKITEEPEIMMVSLQINLEPQSSPEQQGFEKLSGGINEKTGMSPILTHPL